MNEKKLNITDEALAQFLEIFESMEDRPGGVRIYNTQSCCGTSVQMELADNARNDELLLNIKGIDFFVNILFLEHLNRVTIDFSDGGFRLIGFNHQLGCCGSH
ncbi:MAG TPA: hypothetical protein VLH61_03465 [Bacteroidales bacterium]|nr:hypothetical protein [Bacteroidales bacterium]